MFQIYESKRSELLLKKKEILSISKQLLMALTEIEGVIHADLKPANILWDSDKGVLKLIDFGIALPANLDDQLKPKEIQTSFYRAPEVVLGLSYDQSVDMWSFGCILYELCTGKVLFQVIQDLAEENAQLLSMFIDTIGFPPNWDSTHWVHCISGINFVGGIEFEWEDDPDFAKNIIDLLKKILCYENRITPQKALEHRLFQ